MDRGKELRSMIEIEDLSKKIEETRLRAQRLNAFVKKLHDVQRIYSRLSVEVFCKERKDYQDAIALERLASRTLEQEHDLLPGTGGNLWKTMFVAARNYATKIAYPGIDYPPSSKQSRCVLCQQPLSDEAELCVGNGPPCQTIM